MIFGDCGTGGQLDVVLDKEDVVRVSGGSCYLSFMGEADFDMAIDYEIGTIFLTK